MVCLAFHSRTHHNISTYNGTKEESFHRLQIFRKSQSPKYQESSKIEQHHVKRRTNRRLPSSRWWHHENHHRGSSRGSRRSTSRRHGSHRTLHRYARIRRIQIRQFTWSWQTIQVWHWCRKCDQGMGGGICIHEGWREGQVGDSFGLWIWGSGYGGENSCE